MVYVDAALHYGWIIFGKEVRNCHMFCDGDIEELHIMAETIGLKRSHFQNKRLKHYDLTEKRRILAITNGAIELNRRQTVAKWKDIGAA